MRTERNSCTSRMYGYIAVDVSTSKFQTNTRTPKSCPFFIKK